MVRFPGGTSVSGLEVYPWESADGCHGGTPHLHTVCTEAYVVVAGSGELQTLTPHGFGTITLRPGTVAWFAPGTVHRAVNHGGLRVVVIMQNAGLPEAGDAVLTFPFDVLRSVEAYTSAATLPVDGREQAARRRRDLAVEGFSVLRERLESGDTGPLDELYRQAGVIVGSRLAEWSDIVEHGPAAALRETTRHLTALAAGDVGHLRGAAVRHRDAPDPEARSFGMCGRLDTYDLG